VCHRHQQQIGWTTDGSSKEEPQLSRNAPDVVASGKSDLSAPGFAEAEAKGVGFSRVYFRHQTRRPVASTFTRRNLSAC
jgi:hypothetical protein